jgi:hypothetical protein
LYWITDVLMNPPRLRLTKSPDWCSVGRWRCAELFPHHRKTCRLSHTRHPRFQDLELATADLQCMSPHNASLLLNACQPGFIDARLQFTARPLCIEYGLVRGRNFAEIERLAIDDWSMVRLWITNDRPQPQNVRRYVSFASAPAASRRAKYQARSGTSVGPPTAGTTTATETATEARTSTAPSVLYGFVVTEWDMDRGTIY